MESTTITHIIKPPKDLQYNNDDSDDNDHCRSNDCYNKSDDDNSDSDNDF